MKKLFLSVIILSLIGCADKKAWTKDALVNDCLGDFTKRNEEQKMFTTMQVAKLCDCASEKMLVKYKSLKEFNKDKEGAGQIGAECAQQIKEEESKSLIK